MSVQNQNAREVFKVLSWDRDRKVGVIQDRYRNKYDIGYKDLGADFTFGLHPNDVITGRCVAWNRVVEIEYDGGEFEFRKPNTGPTFAK